MMSRSVGPILADIVAAILAACGGGHEGLGDASSEWAMSGAVDGFGSSSVNGLRLDDARAEFTDDSGRTLSARDLRQGMVVEVRGSASGGASPGVRDVSSVQLVSEIRGPVESVLGSAALMVLGQVVVVPPGAHFEVGLTFEDITPGDVLEIYGAPGGSGEVRATRLERKEAGESAFKLRGFMADLRPQARTFVIGQAAISYERVANTPAMRSGDFVRVRVEPVRVGGRWVATQIERDRPPGGP
jgi:hypothetical protein